ncbi:MAG: ADP-forming succinate--CoA ligase subunit beta [Thermoprotei archaeon]|nr:MAG: ADP-forming succinate--CoA ligase subunit beta [Thermoprotei archaeon]HDI74575.1 ADP-forming succinate--CoA ligase subunit beta [Thermoprotei archaeon]
MKLYEYQAREIYMKYGIPVPKGEVASSPQEVRRIAEKLGSPVVIKAQILVAGRGKAGGILFAETPEEAEKISRNLLGKKIKGCVVKKVLVVEKVQFEKEYFLSITVDRDNRVYCFLVSRRGGVNVEELAKKHPEDLLRVNINPLVGLLDYQIRKILSFLSLTSNQKKDLYKIIKAMYEIMRKYDCELVEINPLAVTTRGDLIALDTRMIIDDNSKYRHPDIEEPEEEYTEYEKIAKEKGFSYVELDGDIGVIGNGAGLTMATMDLVFHYGGRPANFLDIGGGAKAERVKEAVKVLLQHPRVKVILVNILGGITRCDEVAKGIVAAVKEASVEKPIFVRMMGTNEEEGKRILRSAGINVYESMEEAALAAVKVVR